MTATPVPARTDRTPPIPWGFILAVWTGYGLLITVQQTISGLIVHSPTMTWWRAALLQMPQAYIWALATPGIMWLGRRFAFEKGRRAISIVVHTGACLTLVAAIDTMFTFHIVNVIPQAEPLRPFIDRAVRMFVAWVIFDGLIYWTVLAVSTATDRSRRLREGALVASQLETQLAQAHLQALKMQLHPHFLFNALHTIGALVRTGDRDNAVRVVAGLGDLLRRLLDGAGQQEVPLKQELEFLRHYLEIEQVRFRDRLKVQIEVDTAVMDASVPHLILQPLVENAIRHGIAPHSWAGKLLVSARREGDVLELIVRDDGPGNGQSGGENARPGIGLANTRARLERLYEGAFSLDVGSAAGGGHEARISLPFRLAAADWQGER